ncbi:MAG: DUF4830 domain-containing protein [Clostridia bacterium]|nr:DUF4830 domain-containing protein [Clostridia bacterium]
MFVYTVRASTLKFFGCIILCIAVLVLLLTLGQAQTVYASAGGREINYGGMKTNEDRVAFIEGFGIKVKTEPVTEESFTMPEDFDRVILGYNQIQKTQGLDLTKYTRKRVTHYSYEVTNYDHEGTVYVNLLVYRNRIIAADISSASDGGFVSSLTEFDTSKLK